MLKAYGKIGIRRWDMFLNKSQCMKVVKDYCVQHVFNLIILKNIRYRYTIRYV